MSSKEAANIEKILLEAHRKGVERVIDLSIRTGRPLIVSKNGKVVELKPKFKYVLVPINSKSPTSKNVRRTVKAKPTLKK